MPVQGLGAIDHTPRLTRERLDELLGRPHRPVSHDAMRPMHAVPIEPRNALPQERAAERSR